LPIPEHTIPEGVISEVHLGIPIPVDDHWVIDIRPATRITAPEIAAFTASAATAAGSGNCPGCATTVNAADYQRIYDSIPFNRAQYNVNPSYRHDSAMEILTGNARHKTNYYRYFPSLNPYLNVWNYSGAF
jgi:hypothetical protein